MTKENELLLAILRVEQKLDLLMKTSQEESDTILMKPRDIALFYKVPRTSVYSYNRHLLPGFGKKKKGQELCWTKKEVLDWNSMPLKDRRNEMETE